jgi:peptide/nickel transport system permease protein
MRRLADLLVVAAGVSLLSFLILRLIPGDAVQLMLGANADVTPEQIAALRHGLGLDRSFAAQYWTWLSQALRGDFGVSLTTGQPVIGEIAAAAGVTAELTTAALVLAVALALPLGCAMAAIRSPAGGLAVRLLSIAGITVPSFWLGIMLLYAVTALRPDWAVVGWVGPVAHPLENLQRLALPAVAVALPAIAGLARILRATLTEALRQDYIRVARAKGLTETTVLLRHALANALIPFVTQLGVLAGYLFSGSVVVEQVFALPGLGRLIVGAVAERDYPLVQAAILLATLVFVLVNTAVDLLYAAIDPRARAA